jgi:hypothetical protein
MRQRFSAGEKSDIRARFQLTAWQALIARAHEKTQIANAGAAFLRFIRVTQSHVQR